MKRAGVLLALALLATACGTAMSPDRLAGSVNGVFRGLYLQQQELIGRTDVGPDRLHPQTGCKRTGPHSDGPGEDWLCSVTYVDGGTSFAQTFELQVKPDGCWKADGPPSVQPAELSDPLTGAVRTNPLAEFDGCLDTSWH